MKTLTEAEWNAEGERLFGANRLLWRFECPVCRHVATAEDFREHQAKGAKPHSATCECLGRYLPREHVRRAFSEEGAVSQPCDYAGYGLLCLSPIEIKHADGSTSACFAFGVPLAAKVPEASVPEAAARSTP